MDVSDRDNRLLPFTIAKRERRDIERETLVPISSASIRLLLFLFCYLCEHTWLYGYTGRIRPSRASIQRILLLTVLCTLYY